MSAGLRLPLTGNFSFPRTLPLNSLESHLLQAPPANSHGITSFQKTGRGYLPSPATLATCLSLFRLEVQNTTPFFSICSALSQKVYSLQLLSNQNLAHSFAKHPGWGEGHSSHLLPCLTKPDPSVTLTPLATPASSSVCAQFPSRRGVPTCTPNFLQPPPFLAHSHRLQPVLFSESLCVSASLRDPFFLHFTEHGSPRTILP